MRKIHFSLTELVLVLATTAVVSTLFLAACSDSNKNKVKEAVSSAVDEFAVDDAKETTVDNPKETANKTRCISNLKNIGTAILCYEIDPANSGPIFAADTIDGDKGTGTENAHAKNFEVLRTNDLLTDYKVYVCPSSDVKPNEEKGAEMSGSMISYAYFVDDSGTKGVSCKNPDSVLASDGKVCGKYNHEKYTAAFMASGNVMTYNSDAGDALADACASKANAEAITTIVK